MPSRGHQQRSSRLVELFSLSREILYGDNTDKVSFGVSEPVMLDETVDHQEPPPRQLSLLDSFSTSELASLDGNGCTERMETEPAASSCSVPLCL